MTFILGVAALVAVLSAIAWLRSRANQNGMPPSQLRGNKLQAVLDVPLDPSATSIYCCTAQLAWGEMCDNLFRTAVTIPDCPLADKLNQRKFSVTDVSANDIFVYSSIDTAENRENLRDGALRRFPDSKEFLPNLKGRPYADHVLVFAYLQKILAFAKPFARVENIVWQKNFEKSIHAFGISGYSPSDPDDIEMAKQVEVFDYIDANNFILRLKTTSENDELVLAKIPPGNTLENTYREVQRRIQNSQPGGMETGDELQIPILNINVFYHYPELLDRRIESMDRRIIAFRQAVRFQLDERGAKLRSSLFAAIDNGYRYLIFDSPFLLYLKEKQSDVPYLAIWFGSNEFFKFADSAGKK